LATAERLLSAMRKTIRHVCKNVADFFVLIVRFDEPRLLAVRGINLKKAME
jgi:hypothetical protein